MEDGIRPNVELAYGIVGRPEDASLGRFHWESWVIEGEQVVNHSTLAAIAENNLLVMLLQRVSRLRLALE